ncbi:hypothetical protein NKG05_06205 [Oerskovia sp. M15]
MGTGEAIVASGGKQLAVTWSKEAVDAPLVLTGPDGAPSSSSRARPGSSSCHGAAGATRSAEPDRLVHLEGGCAHPRGVRPPGRSARRADAAPGCGGNVEAWQR